MVCTPYDRGTKPQVVLNGGFLCPRLKQRSIMLRSLWTSTYLTVGYLLLLSCSFALAQEGDVIVEESSTPNAYDQALLRFNTNIKSYPSWEAFKTAVLSKFLPGTPGTCYELTGGSFNSMETMTVEFAGLRGEGWQKTSGKGWRLSRKNRTFIEYRVNPKAGMLSRIEGVKPRFFFARTKRICEFQL
jgi:hypothetical protein